jgi:uncharacterized protein (DUF433 family)
MNGSGLDDETADWFARALKRCGRDRAFRFEGGEWVVFERDGAVVDRGADFDALSSRVLDFEEDVPGFEGLLWRCPVRMGGKPCLKGHRIDVGTVWHNTRRGGAREMLRGWPYLASEADKIEAAIRYVERNGLPEEEPVGLPRGAVVVSSKTVPRVDLGGYLLAARAIEERPFNEGYDHCLSAVPAAMALARDGKFEEAAARLSAVEYDWHHPLLSALAAKDGELAELAAEEVLERAMKVRGLPPCDACGAEDSARLVLRDATGWGDDPDDCHDDGTPPSWHGAARAAADLFCERCGASTGTSIKPTRYEAVEEAGRAWSGWPDEDGGPRDA